MLHVPVVRHHGHARGTNDATAQRLGAQQDAFLDTELQRASEKGRVRVPLCGVLRARPGSAPRPHEPAGRATRRQSQDAASTGGSPVYRRYAARQGGPGATKGALNSARAACSRRATDRHESAAHNPRAHHARSAKEKLAGNHRPPTSECNRPHLHTEAPCAPGNHATGKLRVGLREPLRQLRGREPPEGHDSTIVHPKAQAASVASDRELTNDRGQVPAHKSATT